MSHAEMINHPNPIKCKKCDSTFQPDLKSRKAWVCQNCHAKLPNLKRHYRSVADLCILGLILGIVVFVVTIKNRGLDLGVALLGADDILLLVTIILIYRSKSPWSNATIKTLIWMVFGIAVIANVGVPLLLSGVVNIPALVIYAVIFPYLFWLNSQANKCAVPLSPAPESEQ